MNMLKKTLLLLALLAESAAWGQQAAQKGGRPTGPVSISPISAEELAMYAPETITHGRCMVSTRGFILQLSDDPLFKALIQEEFSPYGPFRQRKPEEERSWTERMRQYVPTLLRGLQSENGCIQQECIHCLERIKDPRAVEPLWRLLQIYPLETEVGVSALQTLAITYQEKRVVPILTQAIKERQTLDPVLYSVWDCVERGVVDPRLADATLDRLEMSPAELTSMSAFQALSRQASGGTHQRQIAAFFKRHLSQPQFAENGSSVATLIASEDTFEDIRAFYSHYCPGEKTDCARVYGLMYNIGGDKFLEFSRQQFEACQDPREKSRHARELIRLLKTKIPSPFPSDRTLPDWLISHAGEALNYANASEILFLDSELRQAGSPESRAAYWEKLAPRFVEFKANYYWIQLQLYNLYGPNAIGDDEKALRAITAALENCGLDCPSGPPKEWVQNRDFLQKRIEFRNLSAATRIAALTPARRNRCSGAWRAQLLCPDSNRAVLMECPPFGYLEFTTDAGQTVVVACKTRFLAKHVKPEKGIPLEATPLKEFSLPNTGIRSVRLRLLYLPRKEGFYGAIVSQEFLFEKACKVAE